MLRFFLAAALFGFSATGALGSGFSDSLSKTGAAIGYDSATENSVPLMNRLGQYISLATSFLGVVFLILAIYGGFLWMTAQGDGKRVQEAKDMLVRATVGLLIIVSAYTITAFIGSSARDIADTATAPSAGSVVSPSSPSAAPSAGSVVSPSSPSAPVPGT